MVLRGALPCALGVGEKPSRTEADDGAMRVEGAFERQFDGCFRYKLLFMRRVIVTEDGKFMACGLLVVPAADLDFFAFQILEGINAADA